MRLIDLDAIPENAYWCRDALAEALADAPVIEERKTDDRVKDTIQKFHDYQVEWLKSHYDIELEPLLEKMIVRFLHDTANCYMMEEQP